MEYLTVEQTIADVAALINAVKNDLDNAKDSKVILWGSGYGGTIATWTRQKYPHMVNGVWSSSGVYDNSVYSSGKCACAYLSKLSLKCQ